MQNNHGWAAIFLFAFLFGCAKHDFQLERKGSVFFFNSESRTSVTKVVDFFEKSLFLEGNIRWHIYVHDYKSLLVIDIPLAQEAGTLPVALELLKKITLGLQAQLPNYGSVRVQYVDADFRAYRSIASIDLI